MNAHGLVSTSRISADHIIKWKLHHKYCISLMKIKERKAKIKNRLRVPHIEIWKSGTVLYWSDRDLRETDCLGFPAEHCILSNNSALGWTTLACPCFLPLFRKWSGVLKSRAWWVSTGHPSSWGGHPPRGWPAEASFTFTSLNRPSEPVMHQWEAAITFPVKFLRGVWFVARSKKLF